MIGLMKVESKLNARARNGRRSNGITTILMKTHIMFISRRKKCLIFYIFKVFERKETKIKWIYFKRRDIFFHFYIWLLLFLKSHNLFKIPIDNLLWVKIKFINQSVFLYNHLDFESFVSASLTAAYNVIVQ